MGARAQSTQTMGEVYVNGMLASANVALRPGDRVLTGPDSSLTVHLMFDYVR